MRVLPLLALAACSAGVRARDPGRTHPAPEPVPASEPTGEPDAPVVASPEGSGCEVSPERVRCPYVTVRVDPGPFDVPRDVHVGVPPGDPPDGAWPVVFLFQGSFFSGELFFRGDEGDPFGGLHQARATEALLAAGFAVVAPEATLEGSTFWETNVPPWNVAWRSSHDHRLMLALFDELESGELGALDPERLYATGISSGGYMTSRMAVSYRGRFRALAVHSASYATCSGAVCIVPALPADHPPTLFLHGEDDAVVPIGTARSYERALDDDGVDTAFVADPTAGHAWIEAAPDAIVDWFVGHP